jgi:hypothetical protein
VTGHEQQRVNDGVALLVLDQLDQAEGEPVRLATAGRVAAAAVELGWLSWEQLADELAAGADDAGDDQVTAEAVRVRYGGTLAGLDDEALLAVLRQVTYEVEEVCCPTCRQPVTSLWNRDGWWHWRLVPDERFGLRREIVEPAEAGHEPGDRSGLVWLPGPAAVPVDQVGEVGVPPEQMDFDPQDTRGRDLVVEARSALLVEVHDIDFHHYTDGWWDPPAGFADDPAAEVDELADRLEAAAAAARRALDEARRWTEVAERVARVRAVHRRRRAGQPGGVR